MKTVLFGLLLALNTQALACTEDGKEGFMPENDMNISIDAKIRNDMTEERFNQIIDKVIKVYKPVVANKLGILKVARKWNDGTVNASAQRLGPVYLVNMYGGLARHPSVTDDAFALVVCHELGHHLGGAPKIKMLMNTWASNEGQADYFGTLKCFRKVFSSDDNIAIVSQMKIDPIVVEKCQESFGNAEDQALCQRASMAGRSLAELLAFGRSRVSFNTPDRSVVDRTDDRHPQAQCRLDTYFAGSICDRDMNEDVSNKNPVKGTCARSEGYTDGVRPLCWYKP
ncbi:MAG: hypothetical protein Fur0010_08750 [Bdellovibrio sp.]